MAEIEKQQTTDNQKSDNFSYSLRDIIEMVIANWYWFVISIGVCMVFAVYYVYKTPKIYNRTSTVMIKDSRRGGSAAAIFADLQSMKAIPNVENEMFILGSKRLMEMVVDTLNLNISYYYQGKVRRTDLYGRNPFVIKFVNGLNWQSSLFDVIPFDSNRVKLTNFLVPGQEDVDESIVFGNLGDEVTTPVGIVKIIPTAYYFDYLDKPVIVRKIPVEAAALAFKSSLKVDMAQEEASIIVLSINDVNPRRAEDILNSLMKAYDDDVKADKKIVLDVTKDFVDTRIGEVSSELDDIDRIAQNYSVEHNVVDLSSQTSLSINEANKRRNEIVNLETQKMLVRGVQEYMLDERKTWEVVPTAGINDEYIIKAISLYNEGILARRKSIESSSDKNPVVISMTSQLNSQRQAILSYIDNLMKQYNVSLKSAKDQEELSTSQYLAAPSKLSGQASIERKQRIKTETYVYLLNKREENELGRAVASSESRVIDRAYGSTVPVSPKKNLILLLAFIIGCAIPFGVIIILNMINTSVRGRKDLEDNLSIPLLGEVPLYIGKASTSGFLVKESGKDSISEAFRMIRANLGFMNVKGKCQVIMVTSTNAGAGKTFTSMNLALTLSTSGKRVVLVDNDMRKRSLSKQLGGRSVAMGLSKYLSDESVTVSELINKENGNANLDVIFAGVTPPNPAELLMSDRFDKLINDLRGMYDYIVIDSVPALMVADAVIADRVCDLSIYVVREGRLDRRMLPDIQRLSDSKRLYNMSVVLNGVRDMSKRYGYGYGYRYGYYRYTYSYGDADEHKSLYRRLRHRIKKYLYNKQ